MSAPPRVASSSFVLRGVDEQHTESRTRRWADRYGEHVAGAERPNTVDQPLPLIDVHSIAVGASAERSWQGVVAMLSDVGSNRAWKGLATALGCSVRRSSGRPDAVGSSVPGFLVVESDPPRTLRLGGAHRFSNYELTFRVEPSGEGHSLLQAESRASFPGSAGRVYGALVIGGRVHVLAVRAMLRQIKTGCDRTACPRR